MADTTRVNVFNTLSRGTELANVAVSMDANNVRSSHLGMVVLMGIAPIVVYMLVWVVLPWLAKLLG